MNHPKMLYKVGKAVKIDGSWFDYKIVDAKPGSDEADLLEQSLSEGWCETTGEALKRCEETETSDLIKNEEREELEKKAKSLNVSFNSRTSDEVLKQRVDEAVKEG